MTQKDKEQKVTDAYNMLWMNHKHLSTQEFCILGRYLDQDREMVRVFGSYERLY